VNVEEETMGCRLLGAILCCCLSLSCGEPPKFSKKKATEAPPTKQVEEPTPTPTEPSASSTPAVEVEVEAAPLAIAPSEHTGFLSLEAISDNAEIRELIGSMAVSGGEKRKREALKALKSKGSIAALIRAMRAENANIRIQSARILRRLGVRSKAFTQGLIAALRSDPDKDVRGMIAEVMVYYRNRSTVATLIEVLMHDGGDGARINAARALAAIKDPKAVSALIAGLEDKDTWVRLRAAGALKRMGATRAVPALVERLNDPNKRVQERAHQALRTLTGRSLGLDYDVWRKVYPARSK